MKLAFWVVAARTCARVNCPLDVPLPAEPEPAPPELPPEPPEADAQGSPDGEAVEEPLGVVDAVADALGVADIAGVEDAASASASSSTPWRDIPLRMLRLPDEAVAVGDVVAEEDDGARALVRSHITVCTDGSPPELDGGLDDGVGGVWAFGSGPDAATATLTGASITAIAADRPIVTRFIPGLHPDRADSRSDARTRGDHQKTSCIDPSRGPRSVPLTGWFGTPGNSRSVGPVVSQPCSLARRCGANTDA